MYQLLSLLNSDYTGNTSSLHLPEWCFRMHGDPGKGGNRGRGEGKGGGRRKRNRKRKRNTTKRNVKMLSQVALFLKFLFIILNTIKRASVSQGFLKVPISPEVIFKILTTGLVQPRDWSQNEPWWWAINWAIIIQTGWMPALHAYLPAP